MEIVNCLERKDGIKYVIIPKNSKIKKGRKLLVVDITKELIQMKKNSINKLKEE